MGGRRWDQGHKPVKLVFQPKPGQRAKGIDSGADWWVNVHMRHILYSIHIYHLNICQIIKRMFTW